MNGTIICAIDDSDGVNAAVLVARRLAERLDMRMLLVSVTDGSRVETDGESLATRQGPPGAERRLERIFAEHELLREEHRVAAGDPAEAVAVIAAEEAADLIVVGACRGLFSRTLRSSLARELASTVSCPVLVAPPESAEAVAGRAERVRSTRLGSGAGRAGTT